MFFGAQTVFLTFLYSNFILLIGQNVSQYIRNELTSADISAWPNKNIITLKENLHILAIDYKTKHLKDKKKNLKYSTKTKTKKLEKV